MSYTINMINLYTFSTPNGRKPVILLEELKIPYTIHKIDIGKKEQFTDEYIKINPNSKIPAIADLETDTTVFESGAILIYLAEKTKSYLLPNDTKKRIQVIQWLMFQMAGIGPMFGQFSHFRGASEKIPYAINRYETESKRLLGVLNTQLSKTPFMAGDYSIADISTYPWVALCESYFKIDMQEFPHVQKWLDTLAKYPSIQTGQALFKDNFHSEYATLAN